MKYLVTVTVLLLYQSACPSTSNDNAQCTIKSSRRSLEARNSSMSGAKTVTGLVAAELT